MSLKILKKVKSTLKISINFKHINNYLLLDKDLIPPSKIRDLIAEKFDFKNDYIQFRFTAPGDDFDLGRSNFKYFKIFI